MQQYLLKFKDRGLLGTQAGLLLQLSSLLPQSAFLSSLWAASQAEDDPSMEEISHR